MTEESKRKHGGQPGNKNAQKHGFYSRHYQAEEKTRLDESDNLSVEDELDLLRLYMDRLADQLSFERVDVTTQGNTIRDSHYLQQLNTLSLMAQTRATLVRTHYLTRGKGGNIEQTILEALEEIRLEMEFK